MEIMRIVITGPVGAGKSTFIRTISEIEVVDTDRKATDEIAAFKEKTTVAMDFGRLQFGPNVALHLYGTPGQERFDFMWDILIHKAHAFILLVSSHRPQDFRAARRILAFMRHRTKIPMLVGLSHADNPNAWPAEEIAIALGYLSPHRRPPMVPVNALDQSSVAAAMMALIQAYASAQSSQLNRSALAT
ncbi:ATP/GTP-binding protein [Thermosynechococcus sp. GLH187]|uniref:GTP-binding protein n=1 Tax=unclassified Thermosynechococcus TaxID=2622553 RepID=UPI0028775D1B|nr:MULTISPECIES: ATP/GTP-binding protein [unclassified Thermosynechococcus]WNC43979.1 ATP/GTP-binding protein [Thermosynechococcus sp. GLH187]WNC46515.1 ATP/GTP-binding protein [Thermosynechococcus sp. GLH333]WNC49052.1 ATP/GTP-binding protein [Thermosynechococcus sp. GLH87]